MLAGLERYSTQLRQFEHQIVTHEYTHNWTDNETYEGNARP